MMGVSFDRKFWPECGTKIDKKIDEIPSYDLNDLWEDYPDQASVFVAEALIAERIVSHVRLFEDPPQVELYLWLVGGDVVCTSDSLVELISEASDYTRIGVRSDDHAEQAREEIAGLEKIEAACGELKRKLIQALSEFEQKAR